MEGEDGSDLVIQVTAVRNLPNKNEEEFFTECVGTSHYVKKYLLC